MAEPVGDLDGFLAVIPGFSLHELRALDDEKFGDALTRVLPEAGRLGDRLWSLDGCPR